MNQNVVFLSHNSGDKSAVAEIKRRLELCEPPFHCWLDKDNLRSGTTWMTQIESIVDECESAALFFGPSGRGPIHELERQKLVDRAARQRDSFWLVPVLLPGARKEDVNGFTRLFNWVDFNEGLDSPAAIERLAKLLRGEAPGTISAEDQISGEPYRGLERFDSKHADFFFGRDEDICRLCSVLEKLSFAAVVGASGCGKSSLVRAGLQTKLARSVLPWLEHATTITVVPGSHPLHSVASQLAAAVIPVNQRHERPYFVEQFVRHLQEHADGLRSRLGSLFPSDNDHVLLVIDQFEEVLTHGNEHAQERSLSRRRTERFLTSLSDLASCADSRFRIVITLRAEFLAPCLSYPSFRTMLQNEQNPQLLLGELSQRSLREVIMLPAERAGAYFEKGLVERILNDVADQHGSLPLLEHALKELWSERRGRWMTNEAYSSIGGVTGALTKRADETLDRLTAAQLEIARCIFLRLISLGEGVPDTRCRVSRVDVYPRSVDPAEVQRVLRALTHKDARLILTDEETVEVTHEALIQNWRTLRTWIDDNRYRLRQQNRLYHQAREWAERRHASEYLFRGGQLEEAERWLQDASVSINQLEYEFLQSSIDARKRQERKTRRNRNTLVGLAIFALAFATAASFAAWFAIERGQQLKYRLYVMSLTLSQREWTYNDISAAKKLLRDCPAEFRGWEWHYSDGVLNSEVWVARQLPGQRVPLSNVAMSPDGKHVAAPATYGAIQILDASTGQLLVLLRGHERPVKYVTFSLDGQQLASLSQDGTVKLWDLKSKKPNLTVPVFEEEESGSHYAVRFSPDGTQFAIPNKIVRVFDSSDGSLVAELTYPDRPGSWGSTWLNGVAFSPDGKHIAAADPVDGDEPNHMIYVWEISDPSNPTTLRGHEGDVFDIDYSPDGSAIATASEDKSVRIWDPETGKEIRTLWGHDGAVWCVRWERHGRYVASGSSDRTIRIWDAKSGRHNRTVRGNSRGITALAIGPDGDRIASSVTEELKMWDLTRDQEFVSYEDETPIDCMSYSPRRPLIASAGGYRDFKIRLWDDTNQRLKSALTGHTGFVESIAFSHNLERLVSAGDCYASESGGAGEVIIWDLENETKIAAHELETPARAVALTSDGLIAATATGLSTSESRLGQVWLFDGRNGQPLGKLLESQETADSIAFGPDGKTLAVGIGYYDPHIQIWDVEAKELKYPLRGHPYSIFDLCFSPNGRLLASAGQGGNVIIWDTVKKKKLAVLRGHTSVVNSVEFSPDGSRLASGSWDNTVKLWDMTRFAEVFTFRSHKDHVNAVAWSGDGQRLATASRDKSIKVLSGERARTSSLINRSYDVAIGIIAEMLNAPYTSDEIVQLVRNDKTLDPDVRKTAMALAKRIHGIHPAAVIEHD